MKLSLLLLNSLVILLSINSSHVAHAQSMGTGFEIKDYGQIYLVSEPLSSAALSAGLTNQKIDSFAQQKFQERGLRISKRDDLAQLLIRANVLGPHFSLVLQFNRVVFYPDAEGEFRITAGATWTHGINGLHQGSPDNILVALDMLLDQFLMQYISANQN